jgi:hypothetical protein
MTREVASCERRMHLGAYVFLTHDHREMNREELSYTRPHRTSGILFLEEEQFFFDHLGSGCVTH